MACSLSWNAISPVDIVLCDFLLAACMSCKPVFGSVTRQESGPNSSGLTWGGVQPPSHRPAWGVEPQWVSATILPLTGLGCSKCGHDTTASFTTSKSIILPKVVRNCNPELPTSSRHHSLSSHRVWGHRGHRGKWPWLLSTGWVWLTVQTPIRVEERGPTLFLPQGWLNRSLNRWGQHGLCH